ncbi:MerR family transcriptional regulator [Leptolyngbya cf. ectocarpi LEGE 11479]|uniref:MerR family transcriptional regulator n=1 Tax=Leptolyngbya cf. ectocarpi LEGE 11479 TaxID=1828722 RepID=A0A928X460_LEPEC|nr:MerR family transcriptional regulator [Leptolyngbya ectocarpi]MBE9067036.1 MerR family transcriptional regulator [Leptolyngbya cf. ectocarpi LEGE 11479]
MTDLVRIGDLAKGTGLSIRTLHYYDEIGLLSPSHRNHAGHRFYGDQDIVQLQQILSLRQLGFSLDEIRECLQSPEYSLPQVIELHRIRVREQMALSRTLLKRLDAISQELKTTDAVAVENLIETMETISMSGQYFTTEQQAVLETRFDEHETEWQDLLSQIRTEMDRGTDFNSPDVRILARRWLAGMKSFIQGDHNIYTSLTRMVQQEDPVSWGRMDAATFEYMLKAVSILTLGEMSESLIPRDKIFSPATQHILQLGENAIRQINFDILGTEGMLLGFLADDTNVAAQVLKTSGVTFTEVQPLVTKWLGVRPELPEGWYPSTMPFAPRAKRVIELALDEAKEMGQPYIEPEHLLLGILDEAKESGGLATYILKEELGLDLSQLEQQLRLTTS